MIFIVNTCLEKLRLFTNELSIANCPRCLIRNRSNPMQSEYFGQTVLLQLELSPLIVNFEPKTIVSALDDKNQDKIWSFMICSICSIGWKY